MEAKTHTGKTVAHTAESPEDTFAVAENFGRSLTGGDAVLLFGGLGAGKTLFTKGILSALEFDVDEVTSPSFTLVNLYKTPELDVYHIDFWRLDEGTDMVRAVGLDEILEEENSIVIIEWAERLGEFSLPARVFRVNINGVGDEPREIMISRPDV